MTRMVTAATGAVLLFGIAFVISHPLGNAITQPRSLRQ